MKTDMGGAAAVIGAMSALKDLGVKTKVVAFTPMVENMPSGTAIRPGDVLKIRNGKTVEVLNTDAEGRLILADGLSLAVEEEPDAIVDLATLTGRVRRRARREDRRSDDEQRRLGRAGAGRRRTGRASRSGRCRCRTSTTSSSSPRSPTSRTSAPAATAVRSRPACSSQAFVGDVPWVHLDIAGPARAGADDGVYVRGGTGFGVRTLVELLGTYKKPAQQRRRGEAARIPAARGGRPSSAAPRSRLRSSATRPRASAGAAPGHGRATTETDGRR